MLEIRFARLHPEAITPTYAHPGDAAADLYAIEDRYIRAHTSARVGTGIALALPPGYYARILSRSGMAFKHQVEAGAGVIDNGYRGEIQVVLHNLDSDAYQVRKGDRIAQLMIRRYETADFIETDSLDTTARGTAGIGSSGQ